MSSANQSQINRLSKELAAVQKERADIARKLAAKAKCLRTYEDRQARDDEKARRKGLHLPLTALKVPATASLPCWGQVGLVRTGRVGHVI